MMSSHPGGRTSVVTNPTVTPNQWQETYGKKRNTRVHVLARTHARTHTHILKETVMVYMMRDPQLEINPMSRLDLRLIIGFQ